jgi:hypothetical protein
MLIWPICQLQTYSDASFWCQQSHSDAKQVVLMLSDIYVQKSMTHVTSKTHIYASQAIVTLSSTYTLKSQQFPPICNNLLWLYMSCEPSTSSMLLTFLSIPTHQSLEILVCPLYNSLFCVLSYFICSILAPDHYLRSFPSHCLAHCLSIARYIFVYLIFITYAHFPLILQTLLKPQNTPRIRCNVKNESVQWVSQKVPLTTYMTQPKNKQVQWNAMEITQKVIDVDVKSSWHWLQVIENK